MLKIFGRGYEEIGSSDKGLILKNSGKVKVLWGNKYIDLLDSNGNINAKAQQLIKEISSESELKLNGFYFYDGKLIAKIGENVILLSSESGNTYVSFLEEQETSEEEKYKALQNIGFVYSTIDIDNVYPTNGIVYIESEESFYIVKDGELLKKLDITSSSSEEESSESSEIPIPERTRAVEEDDNTTDYTNIINGLTELLLRLSEKVFSLETDIKTLKNRGAILGCRNQEEENGSGEGETPNPNQDPENLSGEDLSETPTYILIVKLEELSEYTFHFSLTENENTIEDIVTWSINNNLLNTTSVGNNHYKVIYSPSTLYSLCNFIVTANYNNNNYTYGPVSIPSCNEVDAFVLGNVGNGILGTSRLGERVNG